MKDYPHTHPAHIREVVDYARAATGYRASIEYDIHPATVYRWLRRSEASGWEWPSQEYTHEWEKWAAATEAWRSHTRARMQRWRKATYLAGHGIKVPAVGTARRLRALGAIGWPQRLLAQRLGVTGSRVWHLAAHRFPVIYTRTHEAVRRLYDELSMTPGTDLRSKRAAARNGWAPPLAWYGLDMDDPAARPTAMSNGERRPGMADTDWVLVDMIAGGHPSPRRPTRAERLEAVHRLQGYGLSYQEIAGRLRVDEAQVARDLRSLREDAA